MTKDDKSERDETVFTRRRSKTSSRRTTKRGTCEAEASSPARRSRRTSKRAHGPG